MHACGHRLRLPSFKGPKEGSHDHGWERELEETLPSPLPLRFFLFSFPSASSYTGIIQNINRKGQSTSYTYWLLICTKILDFFNLCMFEKRKRESGKRWKKWGMQDFRGKEEGMRDQAQHREYKIHSPSFEGPPVTFSCYRSSAMNHHFNSQLFSTKNDNKQRTF